MKSETVPVVCALALVTGLAAVVFGFHSHNIFMPAALAQDATVETKQEAKQGAKTELPPCLAEIAKATVIEDGALRSAKLKDSLLAAQKLGPGAKDMLVEIIQTGTPAGRLISLALLRKIDTAQYQKLADALKQEIGDQPVSYLSPSERCHYSVSDILNDMAAKQPLIKVLPETASK